jgi:hypothetical protein
MNDPKLAVLKALHRESSHNRASLAESTECGCFYCKTIYKPEEIECWCDGGETAICPYCSIDSVIGNDTIDICAEMLEDMYQRWFMNEKFFEEEKTGLDEYAGLFFPVPEWEKGSCDEYQKRIRAAAKNKSGEKVATHNTKAATGLNGISSAAEKMMIAIGTPDGQKPEVKSEDDLQKNMENIVLVTEVCNGETILDQQSAETLNASAWAMLLKIKPEYVKMCDTGKMSTADLMSIMIQVPTIAKHLDVSRLTSKDWEQLVKSQVKLRPLAVKHQINQAS